jgi:hypothetical protein
MSWQKELESLEAAKGWDDAVTFLQESIALYPDDVELYVQAIYLLLNLLLEEDYSAFKLEHDNLAASLKKYFDDSYEKFKCNAEYLFFVGYFSGLAEWYFGQKDLSLSHQMLKQAAEFEPDNPLYQWAYKFVIGDEEARQLCKQITSNTALMSWLESKGSAGQYLTAVIRGSCGF